jgi:hypothetical protein
LIYENRIQREKKEGFSNHGGMKAKRVTSFKKRSKDKVLKACEITVDPGTPAP